MFLTSGLISSSRHLLQRNALQWRKIGEQTRKGHVVAIPPRKKVPTGEMIAMSLILVSCIWFTPFWVLYHLPDYQREDRNKYTGK